MWAGNSERALESAASGLASWQSGKRSATLVSALVGQQVVVAEGCELTQLLSGSGLPTWSPGLWKFSILKSVFNYVTNS